MSGKRDIQSLYKSELGKAYRPTRAPESEPFWRGCAEQRMVVPWCGQCRRFHFYPRRFCPHCDSGSIEWREASGDGTVYSFAVVQRPIEKAFSTLVPYVIAIVELEEGIRMLSHVVDVDPAGMTCGMRVRARYRKVSDTLTVPVFGPAADAG